MIQQFNYGTRQYTFCFADKQDHIAHVMQHGFYEAKMLEAIKDLHLEGVYVDVGAHIGNHTVYFANECPSTRVLAFEPCAENFLYLQKNIALNAFRSGSVVELYHCAIGQQGQRVRLRGPDPGNTGMVQSVLDESGQEVRSIDDVLDGATDPVAVLKLDLEGFEEHSLRGALRSIRRHHPLLVVEAVDQRALEVQESILAPLGYGRGRRWNATPTYFWTRSTDICAVITTFNRPNEVQDLLEDIERERGERDVFVVLYDDYSAKDYSLVRTFVNERGWLYVRTPDNCGKLNFWRLFNHAFIRLKSVSFKYVVFLQDDLRLCAGFFERAIAVWKKIRDPHKVALNLHIDCGREGVSIATNRRNARFLPAELSGWIDCIFLAERQLFRTLDYRVEPVGAARWHKNRLLGSGVGGQLTTRLKADHLRMYRVSESLVYHRLIPSWMNPVERIRNRAATVRFADGFDRVRRLVTPELVIASLATIPSRAGILPSTIASLLDQVDRLNVYLNGFRNVPAFLKHRKINAITSQQFGDWGDAGKCWWAEDASGYYFTVDDDILYPPDYCEVLIRKIEELGRNAVVGVHGVVLVDPFHNYHASRRVYHFESALPEDRFVHILGTGTLAYYHTAIRVNVGRFLVRNAADIFFGMFAQQQAVPLVAVARGRQWLVSQRHGDSTIYTEAKGRGADHESDLIKSVGSWYLPHRPETRQ